MIILENEGNWFLQVANSDKKESSIPHEICLHEFFAYLCHKTL